jgi:hypothetical protein
MMKNQPLRLNDDLSVTVQLCGIGACPTSSSAFWCSALGLE